jgi:L-alanine-DL-glutamate epimerase-like enolase superfamily enzyme
MYQSSQHQAAAWKSILPANATIRSASWDKSDPADFLHPETPGEYARFKGEFPQPRFAAGEQPATIWDFERLIGEARIDVLQPDLSRCGGLTVATQIPPAAQATGQEIVTHSWLTDLLHAYSLHFLATLDEARWVSSTSRRAT